MTSPTSRRRPDGDRARHLPQRPGGRRDRLRRRRRTTPRATTPRSTPRGPIPTLSTAPVTARTSPGPSPATACWIDGTTYTGPYDEHDAQQRLPDRSRVSRRRRRSTPSRSSAATAGPRATDRRGHRLGGGQRPRRHQHELRCLVRRVDDAESRGGHQRRARRRGRGGRAGNDGAGPYITGTPGGRRRGARGGRDGHRPGHPPRRASSTATDRLRMTNVNGSTAVPLTGGAAAHRRRRRPPSTSRSGCDAGDYATVQPGEIVVTRRGRVRTSTRDPRQPGQRRRRRDDQQPCRDSCRRSRAARAGRYRSSEPTGRTRRRSSPPPAARPSSRTTGRCSTRRSEPWTSGRPGRATATAA